MVITLRRLDLFPMFLMLALISIASYGDSDDDFDNDAEIEERMEQRSEDSEEDWEEDLEEIGFNDLDIQVRAFLKKYKKFVLWDI